MNATSQYPDARAEFRRWFLTPPRRHGEVEYSREVSFLELFYDLVYVVVIGQAAHHLAAHVDWSGVIDFAVVFGLIWLAWFNGTLWHELHGREDGRSRNNIFIQMGLLVVLAVFTGHATDSDGAAFAVTYAILFGWFAWQWFVVHRIDTDPMYRPTTMRYLVAMIISMTLMAGSALVGDDDARLAIWAVVVGAWLALGAVTAVRGRVVGFDEGATASVVERFGLVTIIVLGEVVVGVVNGVGDAPDRDALTIAVAVLGLGIGTGLWWNYFDLLGRRLPEPSRLGSWMYAHLPLTGAIAAAGAAMVSLIEHADDSRTPASTAWLLCGAVAVTLTCIAAATSALSSDLPARDTTRLISTTMAAAAVVVLLLGAARPAPIVLVSAVFATLMAAWLYLFVAVARRGERWNTSAHHPTEPSIATSR